MSGDVLIVRGRVLSAARGGVFRVEVPELHRTVLAKRSGKLVKMSIRVLEGDEVECEVSPYSLERGRISFRGDRREVAARRDAENRGRRAPLQRTP